MHLGSSFSKHVNEINLYTVKVHQRGGSKVLTYDIGKEEVGIEDILPSFIVASTMAAKPDVSGTGNILRYKDPSLYFPKPYSRITIAGRDGSHAAAVKSFVRSGLAHP